MPTIDSEAISRAEYDAPSRTLFLCFDNGDWYAYLGVEPQLFSCLVAAPSKGRFFQDQVRDYYAYTRLEDFSPP